MPAMAAVVSVTNKAQGLKAEVVRVRLAIRGLNPSSKGYWIVRPKPNAPLPCTTGITLLMLLISIVA